MTLLKKKLKIFQKNLTIPLLILIFLIINTINLVFMFINNKMMYTCMFIFVYLTIYQIVLLFILKKIKKQNYKVYILYILIFIFSFFIEYFFDLCFNEKSIIKIIKYVCSDDVNVKFAVFIVFVFYHIIFFIALIYHFFIKSYKYSIFGDAPRPPGSIRLFLFDLNSKIDLTFLNIGKYLKELVLGYPTTKIGRYRKYLKKYGRLNSYIRGFKTIFVFFYIEKYNLKFPDWFLYQRHKRSQFHELYTLRYLFRVFVLFVLICPVFTDYNVDFIFLSLYMTFL